MLQEPEYEPTQKDDAISRRILERANRQFEKGHNLFTARGIMASIALSLVDDYRSRQYVSEDANAGIIRLLTEKGAEGEVYAVRKDLGNGYQDSTDFVLVTSRDGTPTGALRTDTEGIIIRASTDAIDQ